MYDANECCAPRGMQWDEIGKYKVRLVAKGYCEVAGVDLNKTFVFVDKFITIRCIFIIESAMDWRIHQMEVKTTFLNGVLKVEIYIDQLKDFIQVGIQHLVCNLKNTLYNLKQLPRY